MTKVLNGDEYEEMAAAFQCAQIQLLDEALQEQGLPMSMRRTICEVFTHKFSVFLDQCWFESEVGKVFPVVGFARRHQDYEPEAIHLNNGAFAFAEYAFGDIGWYFDEHKAEPGSQRIGSVSESGEPA